MVEASSESSEISTSSEHKSKQGSSYKKVKTLGKGAFGTAFLVKHRNTGQFAVIKQIDTISMKNKDILAVHQEAKLLKDQDHPNIIRFIDVYNQPKRQKLCIVMEYASGGDLNAELMSRASN